MFLNHLFFYLPLPWCLFRLIWRVVSKERLKLCRLSRDPLKPNAVFKYVFFYFSHLVLKRYSCDIALWWIACTRKILEFRQGKNNWKNIEIIIAFIWLDIQQKHTSYYADMSLQIQQISFKVKNDMVHLLLHSSLITVDLLVFYMSGKQS